MRILLMQLVLPVVCYFIGVAVGKKTENTKWEKVYPRCLRPITEKEKAILLGGKWSEPIEINHVSYTQEQLGYDK